MEQLDGLLYRKNKDLLEINKKVIASNGEVNLFMLLELEKDE